MSGFRDIDRPPVVKEVHVWADYGELRCLDSSDRDVTIDALFDIVHDLREEREGLGDFEPQDDGDDAEPPAVALDEQREAWAMDVIRQWEFREKAFRRTYPFKVDGRRLQLKGGPRSPAQRLYIFLLLAGSGRYLSRQVHDRMTRAFEVVSLRALKRYLPGFTKVGLFHRALYPGNLYKRIQALAADLGEVCTAHETDFSAMNVGDGGLDIAAWQKFGKPLDHGRGFLTVFGQCACSHEMWEQKQSSCDYAAWKNRIDLQARPQPLVFVPFCYRRPDGTWYRRDTMRIDTILVDRLRILGLLEGEERAAAASLPAEVTELSAAP